MFPERAGWHLIKFGTRSYIGTVYIVHNIFWWEAGLKQWRFNPTGRVLDLDDKGSDGVQYVGPVLTPAQIVEMLAQERERCAQACDEKANFADREAKASGSHEGEKYWQGEKYWRGEHCGASFCANTIRNLGTTL